jgi:TP901 family phage tail tape measure protein
MAGSVTGIKAGKAFVLIEAVDATGKVLNSIRMKMGKFGTELSNIGRSMAMRAIAALTPAAFAVKSGTTYDDIMRKVEARSEGTAAEMMILREQTLKLGRAFGILPSSLGNVQNVFAQAGFNRKDIALIAPAVAALARAGGEVAGSFEDTSNAADAVRTIMRSFSLDASQAADVADKLSVAIRISNFSLEDITTSLQYAAPAARLYNVSMDEMLAVLGAMRDMGIEASIAGTAFRNMNVYMSQAKERQKFNEDLKALTGNTIQFTDSLGNLKSPVHILTAIMKATEHLGTAQRSDLLSGLLETRATIPGAAVGASTDRMAEMMTALKAFKGDATKVQAGIDSGLGGAFRRLASSLEVGAIALTNAWGPALASATAIVADAITKAIAWINVNKGLATVVLAGAVGFLAFGTTLVVVGQLIVAASTILYAIGAPIAAAIAALKILDVVATQAAVSLFKMTAKFVVMPIIKGITAIATAISSALLPALSQIGSMLLTSIFASMTKIIGAVAMIPTVLMSGVKVFASLGNIAVVIGTNLLGLLGPFALILLAVGAVVLAAMALYSLFKSFTFNPFAGAADGFNSFVGSVKVGLTNILSWFVSVGKHLYEDWSKNISAISDALSTGDLQNAMRIMWAGLQVTWTEGINFLLNSWDDFVASLKSGTAGGGLFSWFMEMENSIAEAWGGQPVFSDEYMDSFKKTTEGNKAEYDRKHGAEASTKKSERQANVDSLKEQLELQRGLAEFNAFLKRRRDEVDATAATSLLDPAAVLAALEAKARGLITPGEVREGAGAKAVEGVERSSKKAMEDFQENRFNAQEALLAVTEKIGEDIAAIRRHGEDGGVAIV